MHPSKQSSSLGHEIWVLILAVFHIYWVKRKAQASENTFVSTSNDTESKLSVAGHLYKKNNAVCILSLIIKW